MTTAEWTLIEDGETRRFEACLDGEAIRISPDALEATLGWKIEAAGLCRDDVCVPVADRDSLVDSGGVDLVELARRLERPLALDREEAVASLGASARIHGARLASGEAPDFSLPDLSGQTHSLSDFRGKKVLLIAYASW